MSLTKVSYSMITGAPVNVSDFGAVGDGTTDDTAAIRRALIYAQSLSSVSNFPKWSKQTIVEFVGGKTYKVVGNNPLGHDFATYGAAGTSYGIDLCGAVIAWSQTGLNDALVDYASHIFNFELLNGTIVVTNNFNTTSNGYFVSANPVSSVSINDFSRHLYSNLKVNCSNYSLDKVFNLTGGNMCDQSTVQNCSFTNWATFYYSSNPESVDWTFIGLSLFPGVDNFKFFHHAAQWSGGIRILGCEMGSRSSGVVFYSSGAVTSANNGYLYCNSRLETGTETSHPTTNVSMVDASHGRYELVGMNFFAGGGATTGSSAIIRGSAEATFTRCIVPSNYSVIAQTQAEWDVSHLNGLVGVQLLFDDCVPQAGKFISNFADTGGTTRTFRYCVANGLITPIVRAINSNDIVFANGIARGCTAKPNNSFRYFITKTSTNLPLIADYPTTAASIRLPGEVLITSIKVNIVTTVIAKIGVFFGTSTTPIATLALSSSNPTVAELIPTGKYGISLPLNMNSAESIIWFAGCDAGGVLLSAASIQGWATIQYQGIDNALELAATDVATLI